MTRLIATALLALLTPTVAIAEPVWRANITVVLHPEPRELTETITVVSDSARGCESQKAIVAFTYVLATGRPAVPEDCIKVEVPTTE
jgi:hypothetical protein